MKPESGSQTLLKITQAKAKMFEYNVSIEKHIKLPINPDKLFSLTIGMLGNLAAKLNNGESSSGEIDQLIKELPFAARFFDEYSKTKLNQDIDPFVHLIGSASYYLCDMPGSSYLVAKVINKNSLDVDASGLENLLLWILLGDYKSNVNQNKSSNYSRTIQDLSLIFREFNSSGKNIGDISEILLGFRKWTYKNGSPIELFFSDLICSIIHKRINNSTWTCLPKFTGIEIAKWAKSIEKEPFIKELWPSQQILGKFGVFKGESAVVQMPTSAGKTKAIEIIIRSSFLSNRASLAVIIAPYKALCHEIRQELLNEFRNEPIFIDELTDVMQMDVSIDAVLKYNQIIIATPEKFSYVMRHSPELAEKVGLIIYDEGHQFDNGPRGITFELLLTSLKNLLPKTAQILLISAVINNADRIGHWLIGDKVKVISGNNLLPTFRSIGFYGRKDQNKDIYFVNPINPDEENYWIPRIIYQIELDDSTLFPVTEDDEDIALFLSVTLTPKGCVAIFCGRKDNVFRMCKRILSVYQKGFNIPAPIEHSNGIEISKLNYLHEVNLGPDSILTRITKLGIFAHHSSLPHGIRLAVEYAIKMGDVKFIICTSTLAQGVNLPIRYLIVTSIQQGRERISIRDFQNLIGRSGRSGFYTEGSIVFTDPDAYDTRSGNRKERNRWNTLKALLDPSKSELCGSTLFSVFDPITNKYGNSLVNVNVLDLVKAYLRDDGTIDQLIEELCEVYKDNDVTFDSLNYQIEWKINIINALESFLMANWNSDHNEVQIEETKSLARGTLAHFLADDSQKEQIEELFIVLANNIVEKIPDLSKRILFGRSMYGVQSSIFISDWIESHKDELLLISDKAVLFDFIWPIIFSNITLNKIKGCSDPNIMRNLAVSWMEGIPFFTLYDYLEQTEVKWGMKSRKYSYNLEHIVEICEKGFAYEGELIITVLIEYLPFINLTNSEWLLSTLREIQKSLKYGLPDLKSVIIYELGFVDRVIAMELRDFLTESPIDKALIIDSFRKNEEGIFNILDKYPAAFQEALRNLIHYATFLSS